MSHLDILKADLCGQAEYKLTAPVVVNGIGYGSDADDRAKFDALRALITGGALGETVTLKDAFGAFHAMTAADASAVLLSYGSAYYERWVAVETIKAQIAGAPDEATARAVFAAWTSAT